MSNIRQQDMELQLLMEKVYQHWTLSKRPISARGQVLRHRSVSHTHSKKLSLLSLYYRPFGSCRFCVVVLAPLVRVAVSLSLPTKSSRVLRCLLYLRQSKMSAIVIILGGSFAFQVERVYLVGIVQQPCLQTGAWLQQRMEFEAGEVCSKVHARWAGGSS